MADFLSPEIIIKPRPNLSSPEFVPGDLWGMIDHENSVACAFSEALLSLNYTASNDSPNAKIVRNVLEVVRKSGWKPQ